MVGPIGVDRGPIGAGNATRALSRSGPKRLMHVKNIRWERNLLYPVTNMKTMLCSNFDWEMNSSFGLVVISLMLKGLAYILLFHFKTLAIPYKDRQGKLELYDTNGQHVQWTNWAAPEGDVPKAHLACAYYILQPDTRAGLTKWYDYHKHDDGRNWVIV